MHFILNENKSMHITQFKHKFIQYNPEISINLILFQHIFFRNHQIFNLILM